MRIRELALGVMLVPATVAAQGDQALRARVQQERQLLLDTLREQS